MVNEHWCPLRECLTGVSLSLETLKPGVDSSFLAVKVLDDILFLSTLESLLFTVATFVHYLSSRSSS